MIYLKTSVGIELREDDMLISSLQGNLSGGAFTRFKRIANYRERERESLRQEVLAFFRSSGLSRDNVVLGIPRKDIVLRALDLPAEVADNLRQVVQYQVQSFEPTEDDKFYYDYALLQGQGAAKRLSVMLVMARKAALDEYLRLCGGFGIRPVAVTGASMGLANLFVQNRRELQDKTCILADLKVSGIEVLALNRGTVIYSREVRKPEDRGWKDLLLREVDEATSKIRLAPESSIEALVLAGESSESAYPEIRAAIPECQLIRNLVPVDVPGENRAYVQEAASALGLAYTGSLRSPSVKINLLPDVLRIRQTRWAYVPAAILGVAVLALLLGLMFHRTIQNRILERRLDRQIETLKNPVDRVQKYRNDAEAMEKRIQSVEDLLRNRDRNLDVLRELTAILPPDTYLNTYSNRDGSIQISGFSGSPYDLMPRLERSSLFKDVIQRGSILRDAQRGKDRFSFEMKLEK